MLRGAAQSLDAWVPPGRLRHFGCLRCSRRRDAGRLADPELVYWTQSGQLVFMAVLGGFSNFFGPIVGALTFTLLQDQLQSLTVSR